MAPHEYEVRGRETAESRSAKAKDGGWDAAVVSMLLDGLDVTELAPWLLRTLTPGDLQAFLHHLRLDIAAQALPES